MTSIADQYRIIERRAGWIDRARRGRLWFSGPDALTFLQGLLTNDVSGLAPGQGAYAAWLTPLGRMNADLALLHRGDGLLALVGDDLGADLAARFDGLIFAEQVEVADVSAARADLLVTGGGSAEIVAAATGAPASDLEALPELAHVGVAGGLVVRVGDSSLPAFRVLLDESEHERAVSALEQAGAIAMAEPLATALRIEAGRGEWGHDLTEEVIPLEAGLLDRAISTTKGCYVGQEIVIRILHRGGGRVARRLVTLAFDSAVERAPDVGTTFECDGRKVGHLTSAAWSPAHSRVVALGYLQRDTAEVGRVVTAGDAAATVSGFAR